MYEDIDGWEGDIGSITKYEQLPENAKRYIQRIEEICDVKVSMIGVGPGRHQNIIIN